MLAKTYTNSSRCRTGRSIASWSMMPQCSRPIEARLLPGCVWPAYLDTWVPASLLISGLGLISPALGPAGTQGPRVNTKARGWIQLQSLPIPAPEHALILAHLAHLHFQKTDLATD